MKTQFFMMFSCWFIALLWRLSPFSVPFYTRLWTECVCVIAYWYFTLPWQKKNKKKNRKKASKINKRRNRIEFKSLVKIPMNKLSGRDGNPSDFFNTFINRSFGVALPWKGYIFRKGKTSLKYKSIVFS